MRRVKTRAPVNIALIKYWGKSDVQMITPYNSSLSMTLDNLYTETIIEESDTFSFVLNNIKQSQDEENKVKNFLKNFASDEELNKIKIISDNHVPTAAGLASSASGYAALSIASNEYFMLNYSLDNLIEISRKGSGSACRSFHDGFVAWDKNNKVYEVKTPLKDLVMISVIIDKDKKYLSSRKAMERTVTSSPLYPFWVEEANKDFLEMKKALEFGNLKTIGVLVEKSSKLMHATMLAANPPILYFNQDSLKIWELVHQLRSDGIYAYATNDAGTNVKILTVVDDHQAIVQALNEQGYFNYYLSRVGKGAMIVNEGY